jgi:hypothetical protein
MMSGKSRSLVEPLFDGPVDIVGDVHGEIDALNALLKHLGYRVDGSHLEDRKLVFLGDLTDRGPDSPAVINVVSRLANRGVAQCVLGNHDLNILLGDRKHDNHWFFGEEHSLDESGIPTPAVLADDRIRTEVVEFFRSLPLVLERDGLRVVHACWDASAVAMARTASDVVTLYHQCHELIEVNMRSSYGLDDIEKSLRRQNKNPVKVLTSGPEQRAKQPFYSSGKWRNEERECWWQNYPLDGPHCVFGHYGFRNGEGPRAGQAICADFGIAKRWEERKKPDFSSGFVSRLGAVRFPELVLFFDDGKTERLT